MPFQRGNEDSDNKHEPVLTGEGATGEPTAWRQDDGLPGFNQGRDGSPHQGADQPFPSRDRDEVLKILQSTPREFGRIIEGESRERLARPASDGDWGVVDILPHIGDWEEVAALWTKRILGEGTPVLEAVDDSLWAIEHDYANEDPFHALERFATLRHQLIETLEGLNDEEWQRAAIHATRGRMTLHQFADRICDHDARYLAQARDALT